MQTHLAEPPELPAPIPFHHSLARQALVSKAEAGFARQLLNLPGFKSDRQAAWTLFKQGLSLKVPELRLMRLLMLVRDHELPWQTLALRLLRDADRGDVAVRLLPHCSAHQIAQAGCSTWLSAQAAAAPAPTSHDQPVSDALLAMLEQAALSGNALRLRALFRVVGLAYRQLAEADGAAAQRLLAAARQSGNRDSEEVVFLNTDLLVPEWLRTRDAPLPLPLPPAPGKPPATLPPARPVAERCEVDAMLTRVKVMDKEITQRIDKVISQAYETRGYLRDLGAAVAPASLAPLKERFPLFAGLIDELQARASLLWRVAEKTGVAQAMRFPNVLIVGKPGWGKTYFIEQLAKVLDLPFRSLQMSSMSAGFVLCGSDPVWSTSRPGEIHDLLVGGEKLNPLILLDEIDKMASDSKYPADGSLYQLLEPHQARVFRDEFAGYPIDASHINWFASANDSERIPAPIRSRFDIFELPEPTPEIARETARAVYRESLAHSPWAVLFPAEADAAVIEQLAQSSPREASRQLAKAFGRASLAGREHLIADDFVQTGTTRQRIGFLR